MEDLPVVQRANRGGLTCGTESQKDGQVHHDCDVTC